MKNNMDVIEITGNLTINGIETGAYGYVQFKLKGWKYELVKYYPFSPCVSSNESVVSYGNYNGNDEFSNWSW